MAREVQDECRKHGIELDIEEALEIGAREPLSDDERQEWRQLEDACLTAMERTLEVDHPACQEGALHGLGHWLNDYPERARAAIDRFLQTCTLPELRQYALDARTGMIN